MMVHEEMAQSGGEIRIGKGMKAWDRTIYPIVEVFVLKTEAGGVQAGLITPMAVLIIESEKDYVLSLTGEKIGEETMLHLAPALQEVVDRARGVRRIKVS